MHGTVGERDGMPTRSPSHVDAIADQRSAYARTTRAGDPSSVRNVAKRSPRGTAPDAPNRAPHPMHPTVHRSLS
jgi:hypothetical protein